MEILTELCQELRNWFDRGLPKYTGNFVITDGQIANTDLKQGQYFRIIGSLFNDGVHRFSESEDDKLVDEVFDGTIWAMAVPPSVIALANDIAEWMEKYGGIDSTNMSPFQSESFGGYTYNKGYSGSGGNGSGSGGPVSWQSVFRDRMNRWRKI